MRKFLLILFLAVFSFQVLYIFVFKEEGEEHRVIQWAHAGMVDDFDRQQLNEVGVHGPRDLEYLARLYHDDRNILLRRERPHISYQHVIFVPKSFQEDTQFLLSVLKETPELFIHIDYKFRNDKGFVSDFVRNVSKDSEDNDWIIEAVGPQVLQDPIMANKLFEYSPWVFRWLPEGDRHNIRIIISALERDPDLLPFLNKEEQEAFEYLK
ncbi:hypothetical protein COB57_05495 [Candidatus Peregrinibacteria bacterium]|nr:MAG: hypothetical protein COB57_05495 [Candidatus Peregrinibacteria bacterium]